MAWWHAVAWMGTPLVHTSATPKSSFVGYIILQLLLFARTIVKNLYGVLIVFYFASAVPEGGTYERAWWYFGQSGCPRCEFTQKTCTL